MYLWPEMNDDEREAILRFSPTWAIQTQGRMLRLGLSGSDDRTLRIWNLATGNCVRTFEGHIDRVTSVTISPDGRHGLSESVDKTLRMWELASGKCLRTFNGHIGSVTSVAITSDGRWECE